MNGTQQNNSNSSISSLLFLEDTVDFKKILDQLSYQKWVILGAACAMCFIVFIYTFTIKPQYQTSAILQIRPQSTSSNFLGKFGYKSSADSTQVTQQALIHTRYILEPVILQTGLNISTSLPYFPIFGEWKARRYQGDGLAKPFLGLKSYAWGGEKITVTQFSVAPKYVGTTFKIIAGKNQTYQLFDGNKLVLTGKVGEIAQSTIYGIQLEISELQARSDVPYSITYVAPMNLISSLANRIKIIDLYGNDVSQTTGIFQLSLTDGDSERVIKTLNGIIKYTVTKNREQNVHEAQMTLDFLMQRLPELKAKLKSAENAVNDYHIKHNTLSMGMISQVILRQLNNIDIKKEALKTEREALLELYTAEHPLVIANMKKIEALEKHRLDIEKQIREFPIVNQEEIDLQREAKLKNSMYLSILTNEQQLEVSKAGLESDVMIVSDAVPASKLPSHKFLLVLMGFFMGAFLSTVFILVRNALNKTIENSDQVEDEFKIPVQCVLPYSRKQKQIEKAHKKGLNTLGSGLAAPIILAKQEPDDLTIESLRSLRISLQLMSASQHHVIATMGSLANIGKSFVSLNLAQVMADSGKKTLLIDGDIRKGLLHRSLLQPKSNGLSEYLEKKCGYENLIRHIHDKLYYIPCGQFSTHPLQLFQGPLLGELVKNARQEFEQIIIDMPPILPVSDSILISKLCDLRLFVVSAGKDTMGDVKQALKKARAHDIKIDGIVLNHRKSQHSARYEYRYTYEATNATA